jgi:hypothetical protein
MARCKTCGREYNSGDEQADAAALTSHVQSEHATWTATCGECGEQFTDYSQYGADGQLAVHKASKHPPESSGGGSGGFGPGWGPGSGGDSGSSGGSGGQKKPDTPARRNDPFRGTPVRTHRW